MASEIQLTHCSVDLASREVRLGDVVELLSPLEAELLRYLWARSGQVVGREALLRDVWGYASGVQSRTVDTSIRRLRAKLRDDRDYPRHLITAYGEGYRFEPLEVPPPSPVDLPDPAGLLFRATLVEEVRSYLRQPGLITLAGPLGVGKSAVARAACAGVEIATVSLLGVSRRGEVGRRLAKVLEGVGGEGDDAHLTSLATRKGVVLLDDADEVVGLGEALAEWREACPDVTWLVTRREPVGVEGEVTRTVRPFTPDQAHQALLRLAAAVAPGWGASASDASAVASIVEHLGGLPMAIQIAASRAAVLSPAALVDRLPSALGATALERALEVSWSRTSAEERELLELAAVLVEPFDIEVLERLTGREGSSTLLAGVAALTSRHLLRPTGDGRLVLLGPVRTFVEARSHGQLDARREQCADALFDTMEALVGPSAAVLDDHRLDQVHRHFGTLVSLARWAIRQRRGALAARAVGSLDTYVQICGPGALLEELAAGALEAELGPIERASILRVYGYLLARGGSSREGERCLLEAVALSEERGGVPLAVRVRCTLGLVLKPRDPLRALQVVQQARSDAATHGLHHLEALAIAFLGQIQAQLGSEEAESTYLEASRRFRRLRDRRRTGNVMFNLGAWLLKERRLPEAEQCLEEAMSELESLVHPARKATYHNALANLRLAQERFPEALSLYAAARSAYQVAGEPRSEAMAVTNQAWALLVAGREEDAVRVATEATSAARRADDPRGLAQAAGVLGVSLHAVGRYEEADRSYRSAARWYTQSEHKTGLASILAFHAILLHRSGPTDEAMARWAEARAHAVEPQEVAMAELMEKEVALAPFHERPSLVVARRLLARGCHKYDRSR